MKPARLRAAIVLCLAVATAALANAFVPTVHIADLRPKTPLAQLIPTSFGEWSEDRSTPVILPAPDVQAKLDQVYNQVLARTYINREGGRIMLSLAYGGDQSDGMNVHRPEVCYPAQGFAVLDLQSQMLAVAGRAIPITRAITRLGPRTEPLTYWIVNGDQVIGSRTFDGRIVQLKYTLRGQIPDGMLVRISSIDSDSRQAFALQDRFARDLAAAVDSGFLVRIVGRAKG
jgi:EpsI family protein